MAVHPAWLAVAGVGGLGAVAYFATRRRHSPLPPGRPQPLPDECDPLDDTTWPEGTMCVHDGRRFVLVDAAWPTPDPVTPPPDPVTPRPDPGPRGIVSCSLYFGDMDDHWPNSHDGFASEQDAHKLANAVVLGRDSVTFELGTAWGGLYGVHTHHVSLSGSQIAWLRQGGMVSVETSRDWLHDHRLEIQCSGSR